MRRRKKRERKEKCGKILNVTIQ